MRRRLCSSDFDASGEPSNELSAIDVAPKRTDLIGGIHRERSLFPSISIESVRFTRIWRSARVFLQSMLDTCRIENTLYQYQPFRIDGISFRFTPQSENTTVIDRHEVDTILPLQE